MIALLDTHAFLWFVLGDPQLSSGAKSTIESAANTFHISPASFWEIAIKVSLGRYRPSSPFADFWQKGISDNQFSILPILPRHADLLNGLPYHHKDPFIG